MKKTLVVFLFIASTNSFSQFAKKHLAKPGVIFGKVIDKKTKEPLPYVNITITDTAKKIITGGITNEKGFFKVNDIPKGTSLLEIQYIGYKKYSKTISINRKSKKINLGTILLEEDTANLDEVVVRAELSTVVQKVDRKVINVGKDLTSAGTTASELLNNVQSVSVDSQTGQISLRGNNNVRVLVDGKPTNIPVAQLLQQIPSTSIKSIELITNPSAKYNPEGMSGIINIILHKNANIGFNGNLNTGITHGVNTKFNGSLNMNYKTGKVNFYTNYGYNTGKSDNFGNVTRTGVNASRQEFTFNGKNTSHLLKLGADVYLNDKNTLSFYTTQNFNNGLFFGNTKVFKNENLVIHAPNKSDTNNGKSSTYNINYKLDFNKEGHSIELEATFSNSKSPEKASYKELISANSYTNLITNKRNNTLLNIDYTNPISKNGKLELGTEIRINKTTNNNITTQIGFNNSSFTYDRYIYSGYINYVHKFDKITMQLGARLEQYDVKGNFIDGVTFKDYTDNIFSVYPSAFFTYNPSEKNQWQISYSRRVDRPSIKQVNPIREWSTPLITSIGNPSLKPQFTNSYEINYTRRIKKGSITFGAFYRKVNDEISTIIYADPNDFTGTKQIKSDDNFVGNSRYGLELSGNYRIAKWWRANASLDYYSQTQKGVVSNVQKEVKNNTFNARISNSFTATKKLRFQLFALYRGSNESLQFDVAPMWMINTGASLRILKGKGNLTFRVNDIFKGMKFKFKSIEPFTQSGQFNWESRTVYIGFNYRFGSGKNKAKRRKRRDNNEKKGGGGFL